MTMDISNVELNVELKELRSRALRKLKSERTKFSESEKRKILEIVHDFGKTNEINSGVLVQIDRDVWSYRKFDCLAMWLDQTGGLVAYEPNLIRRIAIDVGELNVNR